MNEGKKKRKDRGIIGPGPMLVGCRPRWGGLALSPLRDSPPEVTLKKWEKGKGWGWVWGEDDELGNLNEPSPQLALKALSKVKEGNVYDLGLAYDRRSYKFVGHSSGEIMSFRTPEGLLLHPGDKELAFVEENFIANSSESLRCRSMTSIWDRH